MKNLFSFLLLLLLTGCGPAEEPGTAAEKNNGPGEVAINSAEGFTDITLNISSTEKKDSATLYHVLSMYLGKPVGFDVLVPDHAKKSGFGNGLILSSTGAPSDNFLEMLFKLYGLPYAAGTKFSTTDTLAYADLNQMAQLQGGTNVSGNSMKLFFEKEGETEDEYHIAEVYLNIDKEKNVVEFDEKDPEYRSELLWFLSQKK
jgi:hypothetical protein